MAGSMAGLHTGPTLVRVAWQPITIAMGEGRPRCHEQDAGALEKAAAERHACGGRQVMAYAKSDTWKSLTMNSLTMGTMMRRKVGKKNHGQIARIRMSKRPDGGAIL